MRTNSVTFVTKNPMSCLQEPFGPFKVFFQFSGTYFKNKNMIPHRRNLENIHLKCLFDHL